MTETLSWPASDEDASAGTRIAPVHVQASRKPRCRVLQGVGTMGINYAGLEWYHSDACLA